MRLLGYTRANTAFQDSQLQLDGVLPVGVQKRDLFSDVTSGSRAVDRPEMRNLLEYVEAGNALVVWKVDRLGRSLMLC
ncbi:DNA invertase Pin-like site-specific DNA recombinase [Arthrobacter sp. 1088]|nr:DNA invertase Pin-like site-specific DNA recombinase [Arthrobacter sp. 1088]